MIVVDTSAIAAILFSEQDAGVYATAIARSPRRLISAVTWVETGMVVEGRKGLVGRAAFDRFLREAAPEVVAVSAEHAAIALDAFRQFGKGRHPASLNIGDCFAYALARSTNLPLLFKGQDFTRTDIRSALA